MEPLNLYIKHKIKGRIRLKFSSRPKNTQELISQVLEHEGMHSFKMSKHIDTALITFDPNTIDPHEVIMRTAIAWSVTQNFNDIEVFDINKQPYLTPKSFSAFLTILIAACSKFIPTLSPHQKIFNYAAIGSVTLAVFEHASIDIKKKGGIDPEILSLVFLINSIFKNHFLIPSATAWMITFGRHLIFNNHESVHLSTKEVIDKDSGSYYYDVTIKKEQNSKGIFEVLQILADRFISSQIGYSNNIFENSKSVAHNHKDKLEGMGKAKNGIIIRT
ncbi:MAG: hypothetical protein ACEPOW_08070 [Bacteroidales bacterium]